MHNIWLIFGKCFFTLPVIQKNINIKELRICEGDSEISFTQYQGCTFHEVGEFILFIDGSLALRPTPGHSRIQ